jgi:predicted Fe-Mo cluster-binding NifX family protein
MKIAVSSSGRTSDDNVHPLFGRCDFILVIDTDTGTSEPIKNDFSDAASGAGTGCAQAVIKEGVEAVVSGMIGPNAYEVLKAAGVLMYSAPPGISVHEALEKLNTGSLHKNEVKRF